MIKQFLKLIFISACLSAPSFANPQLIIDGEFATNPSSEARFAFLQYQYARGIKQNDVFNECALLVDLHDNRLTTEKLNLLKIEEPSKYRDRVFCSFFKSNKNFLSLSIKDVHPWIDHEYDTFVYLNTDASILDDIIKAGLNRGFNFKLCNLTSKFLKINEEQLKKKNTDARDIYFEQCKNI